MFTSPVLYYYLILTLCNAFPYQVEEATVVVEDDSPVELVSNPGTLRNLSAWAISIPYVDFFEDEAKREKILHFCIEVERNDRKEGMCSI